MRQQKQTGRRVTAGVTVTVFVLMIVAGAWNVLRPVPAIAVSQQPVTTASTTATAILWPSGAEAAVEAQGITQTFSSGSEKVVPTASMAKVITALTLLKAKPLNLGDQGPSMTLTQSDVDIYNDYQAKGGSVVRVAPGELLSEYQALQAMLLPSANNVADSTAIWAFGSLADYKTAATQLVQSLGLTHTTIGSDASGLSPDTTSTPSDMIRLGEQAMASPVISQIVNQSSAILPIESTIHNVNTFLGQDGLAGIKTGNSDQVGGNFLFAAKTDVARGKTVTIIGVVMDAGSLGAAMNASLPLINAVKTNLYVATPVHAGQAIATYHTAWGASATATAQKDISFLAWKDAAIKPKIELQSAAVSYAKGASVGTVSATAGTGGGSTSIILSAGLPQASFWWRLTRH